MKVISATFGGKLTPGDILHLNYRHRSRGGRSTLWWKVPEQAPALSEVPKIFLGLLAQGKEWPLDAFEGSIDPQDPNTLVIKAQDGPTHPNFTDVEYSSEVEGAKTETITLKVM